MELPKHTTQVGTIPANKKLYLEDYCISYRKQLDDMYPGERKQIALFGTLQKEKNVEYAFAYGAALLGKGKGRTDSLTATQKEEAENFRQAYFPDYQLVGVIIESNSINETFYWLGSGSKTIAIDGYYIFYDQNEAMLNFMMQNQNEERAFDMDPVIVKKADMDREKKARKEKEEKEKQEAQQGVGTYRKRMQNIGKEEEKRKKKGVSFPVAASFVLLAIFCVYGIRTYYPNMTFEDVKTTVADWLGKASVHTGNYLEESTPEILTTENEIPIATQMPQQPAELDVVVIPDLDTLTDDKVNDNDVIASTEVTDLAGQELSQSEQPVVATEVAQQVQELPKEPVEYLIKRGDNLLRILRTHYGDESKLQEICVVNDIKDPNNIQVGQTILLP